MVSGAYKHRRGEVDRRLKKGEGSGMNAKEYLSQAFIVNKRINSKLQQVSALRSLALKVNSTFEEDKVSTTRKQSPMEDAIVKIIDLENEINSDIDDLIEIKRKIASEISLLTDENYKMVLELRYVALMKWEEISVATDYDLRWVYRIHNKAIKEFEKPLKATMGI